MISSSFLFFFLKFIILTLFTLIPIILSVAFFTIFERKVLASVQRRKGPSNIGIFGVLQPFADGLKLLLKEILVPFKSNFFFFILSPFFSFFISLLCWVAIPFNFCNFFIDFSYSALIVLAINSFGVYSLVFPGISSYSKYTVMGSYRALSQFISYEILLSFVFLFIVLICSSFSFLEIVLYQKLHLFLALPLFPVFIIFFISILAETSRSPFDLPEAESELVSGYSTEYSASIFTFFFLAEYSNMILWAFILVFFFLGGWVFPFFSLFKYYIFFYFKCFIIKSNFFYLSFILNFFYLSFIYFFYYFYIFFFFIKVLIVNFFFLLVRASYPRYRFDVLIFISWKNFLPILMGYYIFLYGFLVFL